MAAPLLLLFNKIVSSVCCPLLLLYRQQYCFSATLTFYLTISVLLLASLCYCFCVLLLFFCYCSRVSFCFFLLIFCNIDPSVFAAAGTTNSPSSPNTNVSASSPNINVVMLPSAATPAVIPLSNTQQVINLKLTNSNYIFWCMQMKPYLIGQGVFLFVDGLYSCPSPLDLSSPSTANINSGPSQVFITWKQQDRQFTLIPLH